MAGAGDVRLPSFLDALEGSPHAGGRMMRSIARANELLELILEPLVSEIALFLGDPFLEAKVGLDGKSWHGSLRGGCGWNEIDGSLTAGHFGGYASTRMLIMTKWNSDDIRLRDLTVLSVVLECLSLTRAAEALGTTQSSISKVLARLRVRFGDPLLVRSGQSMRPTPKALEIAAPLRGLLAAADSMRAPRPPFEARSSERIFRVLVSDVGMVRFVPPLIALMQKAGPNLRLDAVPLGSLNFAAKLEAGDADLALGAFPRHRRVFAGNGSISIPMSVWRARRDRDWPISKAARDSAQRGISS